MNVLLVSHYYPPHIGGIENVVHGEAVRLGRTGHRVTVLTTAVGGPAGTDTTPAEHTVVRLRTWNGVERRTGVPFPVPAPWTLRAVLREVRRADVVHCHDILYVTTWFAVLAAALARRPVVLTQHVALVAHPNPAVRAVQRLVYSTIGRAVVRRARRIAVLNGSVREFLLALGADPARISLLPNGVDTDVFRPAGPGEQRALRERHGLPADEVLALFVGRFVPKKGYRQLLDAAGDGYVLVLAGGPAPEGAVPEGGVPEGVVFVGALGRADLAAMYRACDVFVLPSVSEGFPLTVQEAMASGLPVVTSDDPGYAMYGLDRERVELIRPEPEEIAAALRRVAGDADRRRKMAAYSLELATTVFSWPEHVRQVERLYGAAVAGAGPT
jgi:D-inositol-3-phosphate glycosyltransferase